MKSKEITKLMMNFFKGASDKEIADVTYGIVGRTPTAPVTDQALTAIIFMSLLCRLFQISGKNLKNYEEFTMDSIVRWEYKELLISKGAANEVFTYSQFLSAIYSLLSELGIEPAFYSEFVELFEKRIPKIKYYL